jgi:hypothetical protein
MLEHIAGRSVRHGLVLAATGDGSMTVVYADMTMTVDGLTATPAEAINTREVTEIGYMFVK